jgi:hypothetical protein
VTEREREREGEGKGEGGKEITTKKEEEFKVLCVIWLSQSVGV